MLAFAWYILKVIVCSAVLFGYYWFALRNKVFHAYNRFYLLAVVTLSLTLPLIRIQLFSAPEQPKTTVIKMLQVVSAGDDYVNDVVIPAVAVKPAVQQISLTQLLPFAYLLVSIVLFIMLVQMLVKIFSILRRYHSSENEGIHFVNTAGEKGTPFSFFKYIFWNSAIDIDTAAGNRIFRHEVAHIQEKHSLDKMFINIVLVVCWCNPVFWFIRRELNMIHEFIADKRAVEDGDTAAFAAMILEAAYPHHRMQITNNFFYSPIKRRLMMLTKNQRPAVNYISRLLVLPLAVLLFAAFTIKAHSTNDKKNADHINAVPRTEKQITVVIDAGHGGADIGALNQTGLGYKEKDLALELVKKIAALNDNKNIKIILLRETDVFQDPRTKASMAASYNPDLFISVHCDSGPKDHWDNLSGMSVFVSKEGSANRSPSKVLAAAILNSFKGNYALDVAENVRQRSKAITILQNGYASALIEAGYISNRKDASYLYSEEGKTAFAKNVLNAINVFADENIKSAALPEEILRQNLSGAKTINGNTTVTAPNLAADLLQQITRDGDTMVIMFKGTQIPTARGLQMLREDNYDVTLYDAETALKKLNRKTSNGLLYIEQTSKHPVVIPTAGYYNGQAITDAEEAEGRIMLTLESGSKVNTTQAALLEKGIKYPLVFSDTIGYYKGRAVVRAQIYGSKEKVVITFANGEKKTITLKEADDAKLIPPPPPPPPPPPAAPKAMAPPPPPPPPLESYFEGKKIERMEALKDGRIRITYPNKKTQIISADVAKRSGFGPIPISEAASQNPDAKQTVFSGETSSIFAGATRTVTIVQTPTILPLGDRNILAVRNGVAIDSKNIKLAKGDEVTVLKKEEALAKYGNKASDGAIEISTPPKIIADPIFRVGNFNSPRVAAPAFVNQKMLTLTDGFTLVSATAYFSGEGFSKPEAVNFYSDDFTVAKEQLAKCVKGSAVTFVNIKVKSIDGIRVIDDRMYSLY